MLQFTKTQTVPQKPLLTSAFPGLGQGSSVLLLGSSHLGFPVSLTHSSPPCSESPLQPDRTFSCKLCRGSLEPRLRGPACGTWIPMGTAPSLRPAHFTQSSPVSGENLRGPHHSSPGYSQFSPQPKLGVQPEQTKSKLCTLSLARRNFSLLAKSQRPAAQPHPRGLGKETGSP